MIAAYPQVNVLTLGAAGKIEVAYTAKLVKLELNMGQYAALVMRDSGRLEQVSAAEIQFTDVSNQDAMTIRDHFAMAAMQGMKSNPEDYGLTQKEIADHAYWQADEMLEARKP